MTSQGQIRLSRQELERLAKLIDDPKTPDQVVRDAKVAVMQDSYLGMIGEFDVMLNELKQVKAQRDELLVLLKEASPLLDAYIPGSYDTDIEKRVKELITKVEQHQT